MCPGISNLALSRGDSIFASATAAAGVTGLLCARVCHIYRNTRYSSSQEYPAHTCALMHRAVAGKQKPSIKAARIILQVSGV